MHRSPIRLAVIAAAAISLSACSAGRLAQFQTGVSNFVAGVQTVNKAIGQVSAELGQNCGALQAAAQDLWLLGNAVYAKSGPALSAANSAIVTWCQNPPTDIASALRATAAQVVAAKAAYKDAAKTGGG